jgi:hypothetical protein
MFKVFSKRNQPPQSNIIYELPDTLAGQIVHIWDDLAKQITEVAVREDLDIFYGGARKALMKELGVFQLTRNPQTARTDLGNYFLGETDASKCLDIIEIVFCEFWGWAKSDNHLYGSSTNYHLPDAIRASVAEMNERFLEHRVGFEFCEGQFIKVDSQFLHSSAVSPAIELLKAPYLRGANEEFAKALGDFRHGRYSDATNECLKAFESTMKAICHKRKWRYDQNDTAKRLLGICEKNNLFPPFLADSLNNLLSVLINVATVRNKLSGHGQGVQKNEVDKDTASFAMNSTASNILFLATREAKLP